MGKESGYRYAYCEHCDKRSKFSLPEVRAEKPLVSAAGQMVVTIEATAKCLECGPGLLLGSNIIRLNPWYYPTAKDQAPLRSKEEAL